MVFGMWEDQLEPQSEPTQTQKDKIKFLTSGFQTLNPTAVLLCGGGSASYSVADCNTTQVKNLKKKQTPQQSPVHVSADACV